jgi:hypothetical protein
LVENESIRGFAIREQAKKERGGLKLKVFEKSNDRFLEKTD